MSNGSRLVEIMTEAYEHSTYGLEAKKHLMRDEIAWCSPIYVEWDDSLEGITACISKLKDIKDDLDVAFEIKELEELLNDLDIPKQSHEGRL